MDVLLQVHSGSSLNATATGSLVRQMMFTIMGRGSPISQTRRRTATFPSLPPHLKGDELGNNNNFMYREQQRPK